MRNLLHVLTLLLLGIVVLMPCAAQPTASWEGLVGLFTQPTAETFHPGEVALTYSELRFEQENGARECRNVWFTSSATYTMTPHWEIGISVRNEQLMRFQDDMTTPVFSVIEPELLGSVKYIIIPPQENRIGIAIGLHDITNATGTIDSQVTTRGRRFFVVGSYRWAHLGVTDDNSGIGLYVGANWLVTENVNVIAEWVSQPSFTGLLPAPANSVNFNLGLRFVPREIPKLRVDLAEIGDGKFNFGFSLSYSL